jgi:predicted PurR-regulated permease PerM
MLPRSVAASPTFQRFLTFFGIAAVLGLAYLLRGVLVPLFLAFLVAYALDPMVDRLESWKIPRSLGAFMVMFAIASLFAIILVYAVPVFLDELIDASQDFPEQVDRLKSRMEPWMWQHFHVRMPHTLNDLGRALGDKFQTDMPSLTQAAATGFFSTLSYLGTILRILIVPVFALYLLIDFDRIVSYVGTLVPRRYLAPVGDVARQVHKTLGGYVRGQLTANIVLGALYATGLRIVDIRLAVPIGVLTGMLAFVPYIGFMTGLILALAMAILDWQGAGQVVGVVAVMGLVQILDAMFVTPRIVGRSVGLAPIEVLVTMMAAASLFGFFGVLLAVPLGAVVKILVQRGVKAYLASDFYKKPPESLTPAPAAVAPAPVSRSMTESSRPPPVASSDRK